MTINKAAVVCDTYGRGLIRQLECASQDHQSRHGSALTRAHAENAGEARSEAGLERLHDGSLSLSLGYMDSNASLRPDCINACSSRWNSTLLAMAQLESVSRA